MPRKTYEIEQNILDLLLQYQAKNGIFQDISGMVYHVRGIKDVKLNSNYKSKTDLILTDHRNEDFRISIKKGNSHRWESSDTSMRALSSTCLEKLKHWDILRYDGVKLGVEYAIKLPDHYEDRLVFGDADCVLVVKDINDFERVPHMSTFHFLGTFLPAGLKLPEDQEPYLLLRNDRFRRAFKDYPGVRCEVVKKARLTPNTLMLNYSDVMP